MCLSAEALALFLTMIGADVVTSETARITVHATEGDVEWRRVDDKWCTDARDGAGEGDAD
ncbi:hypothetical protein [Roseovarius sp.]|uniref:hypothetical protein n=1 Tax=Roseovarius sp. TaxID=1486281 RepID=UPI003B5B4281